MTETFPIGSSTTEAAATDAADTVVTTSPASQLDSVPVAQADAAANLLNFELGPSARALAGSSLLPLAMPTVVGARTPDIGYRGSPREFGPTAVPKGRASAPVTQITNVTETLLLAQREQILKRHGLTLAEFAERARQYALTGDEWSDWDTLQGIAFLLHDD